MEVEPTPIEKICSSNWIIFPNFRGENSKNIWNYHHPAEYLERTIHSNHTLICCAKSGLWCGDVMGFLMLGASQCFIPRLSDWSLYIYIIILCTYWSYIFGGIWSKHTYFILYIRIICTTYTCISKIIGVSISIKKPSHPLLSLPTRWAGLVHLRSKGRKSEVPGIHGKTSVEGQPSWLKWKYISKKHNQFVNGALLGWNL